MINLHEGMLPSSAGVEPTTSWSPVGRRATEAGVSYCNKLIGQCIWLHLFQFELTRSVWKQFERNKRVSLAIEHTIQMQWLILKYTWDKNKEAY